MLRNFIIMSLFFVLAACEMNKTPSTDQEKALYVIGVQFGKQLQGMPLKENDFQFIARGIKDQAMGKELLEKPDKKHFDIIQGLINTGMREKNKAEIEASEKFLAEAEKLPNASKKPSGLIYVETAAGKGKNPSATDFVKVHYEGKLRDGSVFDSSIERKEPATFPLNGVIPCWTEGVQLMKVGGKATLYCPYAIAYGDRGSPPKIPGGAALKFDVELISIEKSPGEMNPNRPIKGKKN